MNGLWKKKFNKNGSCYVDIFKYNGLPLNSPAIEYLQSMFRSKTKKNDALSLELRNQGNQQFRKQEWRVAMEFYNHSLRHAADGSNNISLAYANRSSCFLRLKMYEQCLIDIELAVETNYPKDLRKLHDRKTTCLERMQKSTQENTSAEPILSYSADTKFQYLANVLELRYNDEFGKHFVAKSDIEVGEIVILEEMFTFGARINDRTFCSTCFKFKRNFIPCRSCLCAFCDAHCMESNEIHKIDCGASYHFAPCADDISIVKSILIAVTAFSSIDELMKFVEVTLATRDLESLTAGLSDVQLKYGQFLKLLPVPKVLNPDLIAQYSLAYQNLFEIREIQQRSDSKRKACFLMHLLWHHFLIIKSNTYSIRISEIGFINIVGNFTALLNHSCSPNVCVTFSGNQQMAITIRPVKKGDQLFTEYKNVDKSEFSFVCKCSKCVPCYKDEDCITIKLDPNFDFIRRSDHTHFLDDTKFLTLKLKCQEFLTKYGHLPWTKEIELVADKFENCLDHIYLKC